MTAKQYLSQAYRIDQRINSKIEQIAKLREMATKATSSISDMPRSDSPNLQSMESTILKIMELEQEINRDIDELVDLKREMVHLVRRITNLEYQTLIELRYLCFKPWEHIAVDMNYGLRSIHRLHADALEEFEALLKDGTKCH